MPAVEIDHIAKTYGSKTVVDDLSFTINKNEIFGLIGPNGAGKTTTIRMMMDIIEPDTGNITVLGARLGEATKDHLGYLPEERGLYKKLTVIDTITYLASLKGIAENVAEERADALLAQMGMLATKNKKIDELSKGMGQLIQFIVTIVHDPDLIVMDEPFSSLDPVNTELLMNLLRGLRDRGKAIILSTHQMNQVEALCDRILMINQGRGVLYGKLAEIKARFRSNNAILEYTGLLTPLAGATGITARPGYAEVTLNNGTTPRQLLAEVMQQDVQVNRFEMATPSLNDIFLKVVGGRDE